MKAEEALELALMWAGRGLTVFPAAVSPELNPETLTVERLAKKPLTVHGHHSAVKEPAAVRSLFLRGEEMMVGHPGTMCVGIVPGSIDALVVDCDIKSGLDGPGAADAAGAIGGWRISTASGGEHRYFHKPEGMGRVGNCSPWPGCDIRSDGGWVIAAGSETRWGNWDETHAWPEALPVLPDVAVAAILAAPSSGGSGGSGGSIDGRRVGSYDPAVHDALLPAATLQTHQVLAERWGMDPRLSVVYQRADTGEHYLHVTRPGKASGTSATVGAIAPGAMWCFTSSWPGLSSDTLYVLADLDGTALSLAEMEEIAAELVRETEEHLVLAAATTAPPATSTGGGGGGSGGTTSTGGSGGGGGGGSTKPAPLMVRMVRLVKANYTLFLGDDAREYAVRTDGGRIAERITPSFVMRACWELGLVATYAAAAGQAALVLKAAAEEGPHLTLSLRSARWGGGLVLDLADPENARCVMVTAEHWWIADAPPEGVYFRRSAATLPLPDPVRDPEGEGYAELQRLTGFDWPDDERWPLIRGWLPATLLPDVPRPMLAFLGASGSAKTTRASMVISVVDPRPDGLLGSAFSKDLEDDQVKALANYLVGFDNLGKVSAAVSDHLARMVTGESSETRKRYTDDELAATNYKRTGCLTAVTLPPVQSDAVARLIVLDCTRVPEHLRKAERKLWKAWHAAHPAILGAVLDDAVLMLRHLPDVVEDDELRRPRMADFYEALYAIDPKLAAGYKAAQGEVLRTAAEVDPVIKTLREWLTSESGSYRGEPREVWEAAGAYRFMAVAGSEFGTAEGWWPRSVHQFTTVLVRIEESLNAVGITVTRLKVKGRRILVMDYKPPE